MSKYADIEQIKELIRTEWCKYMPSDLDVNLSFVLGKISEIPTIEVMEYPQVEGITPKLVTTEVSEEVLKATKKFNAYTIADENAEMGMRTQIEPIIEVSEDCISKEPNGVWKAKSFHECFCDNCGFIFDIMKCDFLENMKFCPNCGAKMKGADDE